MYAIALWDKALNKLTLIRDRFGEKPIYYGWQGGDANKVFLFTSELKAIKNHPGFNNQIEITSVFALCKYGFIPQPISIYKNIYKLAPGSMLSVALDRPDPIISAYWSCIETAGKSLDNKFAGTAKEASVRMEEILKESVSGAMLSDVPVGVFLSSGIDSTLVASIMQANAATKISAFTIGFEEKNYDESMQAAKISKFLGINHHILKVTPEMMINVIKELPSIYDEPFADSSQIPTYLVSKFAAEHVKVCLTGDGGDELFCGYSRHNADTQKFLFKSKITQPIILIIARYLIRISTSRLDVLASKFSKRYQNIGEKIHKFAYAIQANSELEYYDRLLSFGSKNFQSKNENFVAKILSNKDVRLLELFRFSEKIALLDTIFYLPNDILAKVDRASMSVSLETRAPFLNKKLFEFAMSIPLAMKNNGESSKLILREVLDKYVPKNLMRGPKKGFSIPLAEWLRGPLKDWAESLLNEDSVVKSGILDPKMVQAIWHEHLSGKKNLQNILWSILMFQAWYAAQ